MVTRNSTGSFATDLLVTCEHGGNQVPLPYRHLFRGLGALLASHRGYDPGALLMAKALAGNMGASLLTSKVSRLLVDLNRSVGHRNLHMESLRALPASVRQEIIDRHYQPYRAEAENLVARGIARRGKVVHISCHSFTNNLNGVVRNADIGLLYDPARGGEARFSANWKSALKAATPCLSVRRNFPYEGRYDGLTTTLRKLFPCDVYLGIELEMNQKHLLLPAAQWKNLRTSVINSLRTVLSGGCP